MGETLNPPELWADAVVCDCESLTFLEFWDAHMLVVSPLVCFALVIASACVIAFAPRRTR